MIKDKFIPLLKGSIKHIPFVKNFLQRSTGGTSDSKYCYSVWMRHLRMFSLTNSQFPDNIAELGPGDSLGIGFASLLSGCSRLYAFDVVKFWDTENNLKIFDDLVYLFQQRANINDNKQYPNVKPEIDDYTFPYDILSVDKLKKSLSIARIEQIRKEIANIDNPHNKFIKYQIPWHDPSVIMKNSVDFIYSQAVLEHVENLEHTYGAMNEWLRPGGIMSHTIDFRSHGITKSWNGHWMFNDLQWNIVKGGEVFLINRRPFSYHIALHLKNDFQILNNSQYRMENKMSRKQLSKKYSSFTDEELTTSGMYILSQKKS